jgi:uncharacterized membrane protein
MTFGQILDRTFRLMRANLRLFLGMAAVPSGAIFAVFLPAMALMLIAVSPQLRGQTGPPEVFPAILAGVCFAIGYPVMLAVFALYLAAASYAATRTDLGSPVTFREAYGVGWRRFGRHLWLMILGALYAIVPVLASVLVIALGAILLYAAAGESFGSYAALMLIPLGVLLYIAAAVYSIVIALRFSLAYPVCVAEGLPAWASLKRSGQLTKGAKGRIFLLLLVVYALTYVASLVCIAIFFVVAALGAFAAMLAQVTQDSPAFFILIGLAVLGYLLIIMISCLLSYAAFTTALGVIYHDQRLRKDGPAGAPLAAGESA